MTDHLHAVSPAIREYHLRRYRLDEGTVTVVPRGRDGEWLRPASAQDRSNCRSALDVEQTALVVAHIGRQEQVKNIQVLLRALAELKSQGVDALLLQAGREGHATEGLSRLASTLEIEDRVRWLGYLDDVRPVLHAADLLALPSLAEGMNGSIIEAMASGLPVIASDIPANAYLVADDQTGLLLPTRDARAWAQGVRRLAEPQTQARLGTRGREVFEADFTLKASAQSMMDLYRAVLANRR